MIVIASHIIQNDSHCKHKGNEFYIFRMMEESHTYENVHKSSPLTLEIATSSASVHPDFQTRKSRYCSTTAQARTPSISDPLSSKVTNYPLHQQKNSSKMCKLFFHRYACTYRDAQGFLHHIANAHIEQCEHYDPETGDCSRSWQERPSPSEGALPFGDCPNCRRRAAQAARDKQQVEDARRDRERREERQR